MLLFESEIQLYDTDVWATRLSESKLSGFPNCIGHRLLLARREHPILCITLSLSLDSDCLLNKLRSSFGSSIQGALLPLGPIKMVEGRKMIGVEAGGTLQK